MNGKPINLQDIEKLNNRVGDTDSLQTVDKTNLVNAINELKRTSGSGGATLNVFKRTSGTWGEFVADSVTNVFTIEGFNGVEKTVDVYYKGLPLIPDKHFNVSVRGEVTLSFELSVGESIDYCVSDVSFNYDDLANKPNLDLKANKEYVDTQDTLLGNQINVLNDKSFKHEGNLPNNTDLNGLKNKYPYSTFVLNPSFTYTNCPDLKGQRAILEISGQSSIIKVLNTPIIYYCANNSMGSLDLEWEQLATTEDTTAIDNKITAIQKNLNEFKYYRTTAELGLTSSNTTQEVIESMKSNSIFICGDSIADNPSKSRGTMTIVKLGIARAYGTFTSIEASDKGAMWTCSYSTSTSPYFSGWKQIATSDVTTSLDSRVSVLEALQNGWKVYNNLSEINSSFTENTTIKDVLLAMKDSSMLIVRYTNAPTTVLPYKMGVVTIIKGNEHRNTVQFTDTSGNFYVTNYHVSGNPNCDWRQLAITQKINTLNMVNGWSLYQSRGNYTITGKTVTVNAMVKGGIGASGTTVMNGLPTSSQVVPFLCFDIETGTVLHGCVTGTSLQVYYNSPSWEGKTVVITVSYNIN